MTRPWIDIVGIGEDGLSGLSDAAKDVLERADIIIGGDRHHELSQNITAKRLSWPSPFDDLIADIRTMRGQRLVILVTGDPLWYSVGARISRAIPSDEIRFHPQLSSFQWAAARMGWSLPDCELLTVHGRADSQILPYLAPGIRMLVLTQNSETPASLAAMLTARGFGESHMVVLAALGGPREKRFESIVRDWALVVPDFHTLAIECIAEEGADWYPRTGGLPDKAFVSDGQITKRDIRAITLSKLAPYPDAVLWDIGAGCGSVSIEWMRAARGAISCAVEVKPERIEMIRQNTVALGAEKMEIIEGKAPQALEGLAQPDAVFIGGGLSNVGVFDAAWSALRPGGRLVANVVTLEGESRLTELQQEFGGEMSRFAMQHAQSVGPFRGWKPAMPVTQWWVSKPWADAR